MPLKKMQPVAASNPHLHQSPLPLHFPQSLLTICFCLLRPIRCAASIRHQSIIRLMLQVRQQRIILLSILDSLRLPSSAPPRRQLLHRRRISLALHRVQDLHHLVPHELRLLSHLLTVCQSP